MNEEPEEKPNRSGIIVWIVVLLPVLYVLSVGPAWKWSGREIYPYYGGNPMRFPRFYRYYSPVFWLHDHTSLKHPIESYARWFVPNAFYEIKVDY